MHASPPHHPRLAAMRRIQLPSRPAHVCYLLGTCMHVCTTRVQCMYVGRGSTSTNLPSNGCLACNSRCMQHGPSSGPIRRPSAHLQPLYNCSLAAVVQTHNQDVDLNPKRKACGVRRCLCAGLPEGLSQSLGQHVRAGGGGTSAGLLRQAASGTHLLPADTQPRKELVK